MEHILVVDDDPAIRDTVSEILALEGYQVETAGNGEEALAAIERSKPRLMLLDMRMPVLDGWGVAAELKRRGIQVRIAVVTAAQDGARWAREIEAPCFLAKPFDVDDLLSTVEHCSQVV